MKFTRYRTGLNFYLSPTLALSTGLMQSKYDDFGITIDTASTVNVNAKNMKINEVNMPGLQGEDTIQYEVRKLRKIFRSHKGISRAISNITYDIVTTTKAEDKTLRDAIVSHVSMMMTRLEEGKSPEVIIQSPKLDTLFGVHNEIDTEIELTDTGVKVIQTSSNPREAGLLQAHAAEVSDVSE